MRLLQGWTTALAATVALSGAAFADVTVSQSNDPAITLGGQMTSLLGMERTAMGQVAPARLAALADGVQIKRPSAKREAKKAGLPEISTPNLIRYDNSFLDALPATSGDEQWQCLTTALYHEARGESVRGQFAVAEVILNRADSPAYPRSICGVVNQGCQFSYTCDGKSDRAKEKGAWIRAGKIARLMMDGAPRALTAGATHFHTVNIRPSWSRRFERTAAIGAHLFYRQ